MKSLIRRILLQEAVAKKVVEILAKIHQLSYSYLGTFASASEGGLHPKHRLLNYHKFFIDNVARGDTVLDIGCGNGALLRDVAIKTEASAVGIDISKDNVECAKARLCELPNIMVIESDVWKYNDDRHFDIILLSNVLEHLDRRAELLRLLCNKFKPKAFLIRVPMFEREWLVPYKKELGFEWRLDSTHQIEYTEEEFRSELAESGLDIRKIIFKWGEIYAVAFPTAHLSRHETE